jgi:hypothetical protein
LIEEETENRACCNSCEQQMETRAESNRRKVGRDAQPEGASMAVRVPNSPRVHVAVVEYHTSTGGADDVHRT